MEVQRHALPADVVRTSALVTGVDDAPSGSGRGEGVKVTLTTPGGEVRLDADLLVAADGIASTVRRQVWPSDPGPAFRGRTVWCGLTEPDSIWPVEASLTLGNGEQFGLLPLPGRRVYWFLTADADAAELRAGDKLAEIRRRVGGWHAPIPTRLATSAGLQAALAGSDHDRRSRTQQMARAARQSSRRNQRHGRMTHTLAALFVRLAPQRVWTGAVAAWADWTPPEIPAHS